MSLEPLPYQWHNFKISPHPVRMSFGLLLTSDVTLKFCPHPVRMSYGPLLTSGITIKFHPHPARMSFGTLITSALTLNFHPRPTIMSFRPPPHQWRNLARMSFPLHENCSMEVSVKLINATGKYSRCTVGAVGSVVVSLHTTIAPSSPSHHLKASCIYITVMSQVFNS